MAVIVEMPKLSDTMEEGGVAGWLKSEGEEIEEGEPLLEIETDKATMEYSSPEEGVLLKILVEAGKTVELNAPIAVVGTPGETFDLSDLLSKAGATATKSVANNKKEVAAPGVEVVAAGGQSRHPAGSIKGAAPFSGAVAAVDGGSIRIKASPLAKKMAAERGVDLASIDGSGPAGRIVAKDVETRGSGSLSESSSESSSGFQTRLQETRAPELNSTGEDTIVPLSMMRKTIAKRLLAGKNEAPHFYLTVSANMEKMFEWRKDLNAQMVDGGAAEKVSVNDLIMMAAGRALRLHPEVNSSWAGDSIVQHGGVHISMAVALPSGLVTPVIRNIDQIGVRQIARQAKEYGRRAREGKLTNDDYQGGTFTISNLGMTGIEEFTAIINPPQACILAVGRTIAQPWVDDEGEIVAVKRMKLTLSSDHRVVDGMVGAKFLETLVRSLENPLLMLS